MRMPVSVLGLFLLLLSGCGFRPEKDPTSPAPSTASDGTSNDSSLSPLDADDLPAITVSHETTSVLGPLNDRGGVDFVAAVNRSYSAVKPEQNAALALVKILGSGLDEPAAHSEFVSHFRGDENMVMRTGSLISQGEYAGKENIEPAGPFFDRCATAASRPWASNEFPHVAAWLESCDSDLDRCVEATRRPQYYYPLVAYMDEETSKLVSPLTGALLPLPQNCRGVARGLTARAMRRAGASDMPGASRDILAVFRLGRLVGQGSTLIEWLVGVAIESMANECVIALVNSGELNAENTATLEAELTALLPPPELEEKLRLGERLMALDLAVAMAHNGPNVLGMVSSIDLENATLDASSIDWDTTLRTINQWYDRLGDAIGKPIFSERTRAVNDLNDSSKQVAKADLIGLHRIFQGASGDATARGKQLGDFIAALMIPGSVQTHAAETRSRNRFDLTLLALRLHSYRLENKTFPENLDAVNEDGRVDRFTGEPLIYRYGEGFCVVYARGPNQSDDGGPPSTDSDSSDDVGYRLVTD